MMPIGPVALSGAKGRSEPEAIKPLMEFRVRALITLGKFEALPAAKSYYNSCDLSSTARAVELVAQCLTKAHPEDPTIAQKFKAEQLQASAGTRPNRSRPVY